MNLYDTFEAKYILSVIIQDGHGQTYYIESREMWRLFFSPLKDSFALYLLQLLKNIFGANHIKFSEVPLGIKTLYRDFIFIVEKKRSLLNRLFTLKGRNQLLFLLNPISYIVYIILIKIMFRFISLKNSLSSSCYLSQISRL